MNGAFDESYRERVRQVDAAARFAIEGRRHQYSELRGDPTPTDPQIIMNVRMLYRLYGTLSFVFEGRQGYIDILPWCDEGQIIDDYLSAAQETMRIGVVEGFKPSAH